MYQEDEDPCAICHEELTVGNTQTLECAHKFHDEVGGVLIELGYETRSDTNRGWWCFN